jgi:rhodanese-related sulfurtransferase
MVVRVDALEAEQLIADGIHTIDVLPADVYEKVHLPGATSMPLAEFEPSQVASYDPSAPLLVYCFDQHCDLSARASARLEQLGFDHVHDLIGGRAAWTALGLPTEGTTGDQGRVSGYALDVPTARIDATLADITALAEQRFPVPITNADRVLLGAVEPSAAAKLPTTPVAEVMVPAPRTIRPEVRVDDAVAQLRKDGLDHVFITAVNGVLVGLVITDQLPGS